MKVLSIDIGRVNMGVCALHDAPDAADADSADAEKLVWWGVVSVAAPADAAAVARTLDDVVRESARDAAFDVVLIERQPPRAPAMCRLQHYCEMYFARTWPSTPTVLVDARLKLTYASRSPHWPRLEAPPKTYYQRKKASVAVVREYVRCERHGEAAQTFNLAAKQDDLADCLLQALAWSAQQRQRQRKKCGDMG